MNSDRIIVFKADSPSVCCFFANSMMSLIPSRRPTDGFQPKSLYSSASCWGGTRARTVALVEVYVMGQMPSLDVDEEEEEDEEEGDVVVVDVDVDVALSSRITSAKVRSVTQSPLEISVTKSIS